MKLYLFTFIFILSFNLLGAETILKVDTKNSVVHWTGSKIVGKHNGTLLFKEGKVVLNEKGQLTAGEFQVDMKTLNDEDLTGELKGKLEGHLKSDDFFSVEKFPVSTLKFTKITLKEKNEYSIEGILTIKGKSSPVIFSAQVDATSKTLSSKSQLTFDRTVYDVRYGSGKFFQNLGDKVINDNIELKVDLVAGP